MTWNQRLSTSLYQNVCILSLLFFQLPCGNVGQTVSLQSRSPAKTESLLRREWHFLVCARSSTVKRNAQAFSSRQIQNNTLALCRRFCMFMSSNERMTKKKELHRFRVEVLLNGWSTSCKHLPVLHVDSFEHMSNGYYCQQTRGFLGVGVEMCFTFKARFIICAIEVRIRIPKQPDRFQFETFHFLVSALNN